MGQFAKASVVSVACFVLPWLFAAWFFLQNYSLPLPCSLWLSGFAAAIVGCLLYADRETCLERFYRKIEPEKPVNHAPHPELKLQGFLRLVALYVVLAVVWTGGCSVAASYLRTHTHIGPFTWAAPFRWAAEAFLVTSSAPGEIALGAFLFAGAIGSAGYVAGRALLFPDQGPVRRGRKVGSAKVARRELAKHHKAGEPEIVWGGLRLPWSAGPKHFLTAGMTGSGKTNLLLQFMASILVRIGRAKDERALVYDPKTELLSFLYGLGIGQRVRILHPLDVRGSAWDLAADVTTPSAAQQMAAVLIPEEKESKHPFFSLAAQQLLAGAFVFLMKAAPRNWDLRDAILLMERREILRQALERNPETAALVEEYFQHQDCFADVRATMANWLRRYRPIAACWHHAKDKLSL